MKMALIFLFFAITVLSRAQNRAENIIIITTDGFRWQEVFTGMDSALANNPKFNQEDSEYIYKKYWSNDVNRRREKLMPFLWKRIAEKGQVYGNRNYDNKVNCLNPYWFSYPGYSEIMTGFVDTAINSNEYPPNPHSTVLEFFNRQSKLKGKVAVFGAWEAFNRIFNERHSGIPAVSGFDPCGGNNPDANEKLINAMLKDSYREWGDDECLDVFTHYEALEELKIKKPEVLYIAYGETDEWAHSEKYRSYLDAAHQVDAWIREIWNFVQGDIKYRNKTTIFITVDHGRGDEPKSNWTSHNNTIANSDQIWFAVIGPGIKPKGEIRERMQLYQQQFAQTIARLMGYKFQANHPVTEEIKEIFK